MFRFWIYRNAIRYILPAVMIECTRQKLQCYLLFIPPPEHNNAHGILIGPL